MKIKNILATELFMSQYFECEICIGSWWSSVEYENYISRSETNRRLRQTKWYFSDSIMWFHVHSYMQKILCHRNFEKIWGLSLNMVEIDLIQYSLCVSQRPDHLSNKVSLDSMWELTCISFFAGYWNKCLILTWKKDVVSWKRLVWTLTTI